MREQRPLKPSTPSRRPPPPKATSSRTQRPTTGTIGNAVVIQADHRLRKHQAAVFKSRPMAPEVTLLVTHPQIYWLRSFAAH
ncbi:hypothetical protein QWZ13_07515 [Reinekea marina]|uniref:hypothetical protein n=1 Tax=Reinekea marina TaxID=1310421 RepID=UPI0025B52437|nr:hypothetical protein [Reinekea marina]MDN3648757.1 hypothetical protein [Reinekea marina]